MMTKEQIGTIINPDFPGVYAPTSEPTKLIFDDGSFKVGYFESTSDSEKLERENKFRFVEFGDRGQIYRVTRGRQYVTIVDANKLASVEYPSYSAVLMSRLRKMDIILKDNNKVDWQKYKGEWVESINDLYGTIMHKWLEDYEGQGLVKFLVLPAGRFEVSLGEYMMSVLEITLNTEHTIVIEPIAAITSEYDGRLDFYMRGVSTEKFFFLEKYSTEKTMGFWSNQPSPKIICH